MTKSLDQGARRGSVSDPEESLVTALLEQYLAAAEAGQPRTLAEICGGRPDLVARLGSMLRIHEALPGRDEPFPEHADPLIGRRLGGRYRLTDWLGAGAMGRVYAAHDEQLGREVAVKVLGELFAGDPERVARLRREAESLASLDHPNIVPVHDLNLDERPAYLVMERVQGFGLAALLDALRQEARPGGLPDRDLVLPIVAKLAGVAASGLGELFARPWPQVVALLGSQLCQALGAAHQLGIVHRDVKPSNLMVDMHGRLRLLDFGLARREVDSTLTRTGQAVGTPRYMAPEQLAGDAGPRSDLYSAGATLYECVCLCPPFVAESDELLAQIRFLDPPSLCAGRPNVSRDLAAICARALAKAPARRYPDAAAFAADLRRFLDCEPVLARAMVLPESLRVMVGAYRRHRLAVRTIAGVSLAAIGLTIVGSLLLGDRLAADANARASRLRELRAQLPPTLGIGGQVQERLEHPRRAQDLAVLDQILVQDPNDDEARFLRHTVREEELLDGRGEPDPGLSQDLDADQAILTQRLGEARLLALRQAVAYMRGPPREPERARRLLLDLDGEHPVDPVAWRLRLLAEVFTRTKESWAAADELALQLARSLGASALTHWARGAVRLDSDWPGALQELEASRELCPHHANTLHSLSQVLRRLGQAAAALRWIEQARQLVHRPHVNYLEQHHLVLRDLGQLEAAERVLDEFPAEESALRTLCLVQLRFRQAEASDADRRASLLAEAEQVLVALDAEVAAQPASRPGRSPSERDADRRLRKAIPRNLEQVRASRSAAAPERAKAYLLFLLSSKNSPLDPAFLGRASAELQAVGGDLPVELDGLLRELLQAQAQHLVRLRGQGQ